MLLSYTAGRVGDDEQQGPGKRPHALAKEVSRLKHLPQQPEEHLCLHGDELAACTLPLADTLGPENDRGVSKAQLVMRKMSGRSKTGQAATPALKLHYVFGQLAQHISYAGDFFLMVWHMMKADPQEQKTSVPQASGRRGR